MANYNLTTEQEKGIALYIHTNGEDYFIITNGDECFPFSGYEQEQRDLFLEEKYHTEHTESDFLQWCKDTWKYDAKMDGRGHSLATYDGHECVEHVNSTYYYIYRIN